MRQRTWSTAIEGTRDLSEWALYSTSYLLTGAVGQCWGQRWGRPPCSWHLLWIWDVPWLLPSV